MSNDLQEDTAPEPSSKAAFRTKKAPPLKPKHRRARAQETLAVGIVIAFFVLHGMAVAALALGWFNTDSYKEVIIALSGPLGLATAVTAFYYGEHRGKNAAKRRFDRDASS